MMEARLWGTMCLYLTETVPLNILKVCYGTTLLDKWWAYRHILDNGEKSGRWCKERWQNRQCQFEQYFGTAVWLG